MFTYYMPTKIIAGTEAVSKNSSDLILGTRAVIVTGKSSGKLSGALDDVINALDKHAVPYLIYDKVSNNPAIEETVEGGKAARDFNADFIISIGGGSPLDAAKAIAVYAVNEPIDCSDFEMQDIFKGTYKNKPLPMAAVPTTIGTGSEVTPYSILTLHDIKNKRNFSSNDIFYKVAFLDGRYVQKLSLQVARNTAVDAMCHLIEGFTDKKSSPASDYIALEGLRLIGSELNSLLRGDMSEESCTKLLWAATLGGMVIAQTGTTIVHSMGYPLTYYKDIPHGMANGMLLGEYMSRTQSVLLDKIDMCISTLGVNSVEDFRTYLKTILPCNVEFTEKELTEWTKTTIQAKNIAVCPFDVTREMEVEMYIKSLI